MSQVQTAQPQRAAMPNNDEMPIGTVEAAEVLGVKLQTVYNMISRRQIPYSKSPTGKKVYFLKSELRAWMLSNRVATVDEIDQAATEYVNSHAHN